MTRKRKATADADDGVHNIYWPARAILDEDRTRYYVDWLPAPSGKRYEPSWEPRDYVTGELVRHWEVKKRDFAQTVSGEAGKDGKDGKRRHEADRSGDGDEERGAGLRHAPVQPVAKEDQSGSAMRQRPTKTTKTTKRHVSRPGLDDFAGSGPNDGLTPALDAMNEASQSEINLAVHHPVKETVQLDHTKPSPLGHVEQVVHRADHRSSSFPENDRGESVSNSTPPQVVSLRHLSSTPHTSPSALLPG